MHAKSRWVFWLAAAAVVSAAADGRSESTTDMGTLYQHEGTKLERSNTKWTQNDNCGKESFLKFPDFTVEAAASRDAYMRDCLRKRHLPPRNDVAQPVKRGP